jgi:hypothetical protein
VIGQLHATATLSRGKIYPYPLVADRVCSWAGLGAEIITTVPWMPSPLHCHSTDCSTKLRRERVCVCVCVCVWQHWSFKFCSCIKDLTYTDRNNFCFTVVFVADEEDHEFDGTPSLSHEKSDNSLCSIHSVCIPIKSCTLLQDLMQQNCLATEK